MSKSLKYVKEFEYPSSFGFSGSSGQTVVKGHARSAPKKMATGGAVKAVDLGGGTGNMQPTAEHRAAMAAGKGKMMTTSVPGNMATTGQNKIPQKTPRQQIAAGREARKAAIASGDRAGRRAANAQVQEGRASRAAALAQRPAAKPLQLSGPTNAKKGVPAYDARPLLRS